MRFKESCLYRCTLESSIQLLYYKHYQIRKIANMTAQEKKHRIQASTGHQTLQVNNYNKHNDASRGKYRKLLV